MTWFVALVTTASIVVSLARWLRVSQREHYIAGSCWTTAMRWARRRPPNLVLGLAADIALIGGIVLYLLGMVVAGTLLIAYGALLTAIFPWPMPVRGTPPLRFTRRARTLAAIAIGLIAAVVIVVGLVTSVVPALAVGAGVTFIMVDAAAALAGPIERAAAERHRKRAEARLRQVDPFIIAVTGSWGKTSTKNHVRDLISGSAEVVASPASWNNTGGLSRTVNEHLTDTTEVLVAEMGTYGLGEIRAMCSWVPPKIAIICAIGPMHLERMGTIETIVEAKSEILEGAEVAVLWVDDPRLAAVADAATNTYVIRVGTRGSGELDVEVAVEPGDDGQGDHIVVWSRGDRIGTCPVELGAHPGNVGCAVAAALAYGVSAMDIPARLARLSNPSHRATMATSDAGVVVIDDTFNSNPAGAHAALDRLTEAVSGRRVVITPGMVELGSIQDEENERFAASIAESGATLIAVGWTNRAALVRGGGPDTMVMSGREEARSWIRANLAAGDGVLWENDLPDHYP